MGRMKSNPRHYRFTVPAPITGTATSGAAGAVTAVIEAADITVDNDLNGWFIVITGGPGAGQVRRVLDTDNATSTVTVDEPWVTALTGASTYTLYIAIENRDIIGIAQAGAAQTITLADSAIFNIDDFYNGLRIDLVAGTGSGGIGGTPKQQRMIIDYVAATRVATVNKPWTTNPAVGTTYRIQGHLYYPVTDLDIDLVAGTAFDIATIYGGIGAGMYDTTTRFGPFDERVSFNIVEFGTTGVYTIRRWD